MWPEEHGRGKPKSGQKWAMEKMLSRLAWVTWGGTSAKTRRHWASRDEQDNDWWRRGRKPERLELLVPSDSDFLRSRSKSSWQEIQKGRGDQQGCRTGCFQGPSKNVGQGYHSLPFSSAWETQVLSWSTYGPLGWRGWKQLKLIFSTWLRGSKQGSVRVSREERRCLRQWRQSQSGRLQAPHRLSLGRAERHHRRGGQEGGRQASSENCELLHINELQFQSNKSPVSSNPRVPETTPRSLWWRQGSWS